MANKKKNNTDETKYTDFVIDDTVYSTLLNKKFKTRKPYVPENPDNITSFMPGTINKIYVKKGQEVNEGDKLLILEAMKMKNILFASKKGKIKKINIKEGQMVPKNFVLVEVQ